MSNGIPDYFSQTRPFPTSGWEIFGAFLGSMSKAAQDARARRKADFEEAYNRVMALPEDQRAAEWPKLAEAAKRADIKGFPAQWQAEPQTVEDWFKRRGIPTAEYPSWSKDHLRDPVRVIPSLIAAEQQRQEVGTTEARSNERDELTKLQAAIKAYTDRGQPVPQNLVNQAVALYTKIYGHPPATVEELRRTTTSYAPGQPLEPVDRRYGPEPTTTTERRELPYFAAGGEQQAQTFGDWLKKSDPAAYERISKTAPGYLSIPLDPQAPERHVQALYQAVKAAEEPGKERVARYQQLLIGSLVGYDPASGKPLPQSTQTIIREGIQAGVWASVEDVTADLNLAVEAAGKDKLYPVRVAGNVVWLTGDQYVARMEAVARIEMEVQKAGGALNEGLRKKFADSLTAALARQAGLQADFNRVQAAVSEAIKRVQASGDPKRIQALNDPRAMALLMPQLVGPEVWKQYQALQSQLAQIGGEIEEYQRQLQAVPEGERTLPPSLPRPVGPGGEPAPPDERPPKPEAVPPAAVGAGAAARPGDPQTPQQLRQMMKTNRGAALAYLKRRWGDLTSAQQVAIHDSLGLTENEMLRLGAGPSARIPAAGGGRRTEPTGAQQRARRGERSNVDPVVQDILNELRKPGPLTEVATRATKWTEDAVRSALRYIMRTAKSVPPDVDDSNAVEFARVMQLWPRFSADQRQQLAEGLKLTPRQVQWLNERYP